MGRWWAEYRWVLDLESMFCSLRVCVWLFLNRATGCKWECRRESCGAPWKMENQSPIQYYIFLPGSLCVELYFHYLLCCRGKKRFALVCFWQSQMSSYISKLSTSTDGAILVNVKKAAKEDWVFFVCLFVSVCNQWCNVAISGFTMKWKKMEMKRYTGIHVCTVNRWRAWKMLEQWLTLIVTEKKMNTAEFPSLYPGLSCEGVVDVRIWWCGDAVESE